MDEKEKFISSCTFALSKSYEPKQVEHIRNVLTVELGKYNISQITTELTIPDDESNMKLLTMFLMTKKVEGCTDRTITYYKDEIQKFLLAVQKPVAEITSNDIKLYLAKMAIEKGVSAVTQNNVRRNISSFFTWLSMEEYINRNPAMKVKKIKEDKKVKKPLDDEEVEMLRNAPKNFRDKAIVETLLSTGIRVGELVNINISDIDGDQLVVYGKGKKERIVYLNAKARIAIREYLKSRDDNNPALFVTLDSPYARLKITGVEIVVRNLGRSVNIKAHPHKLRRTSATAALNRGMPMEEVRQMLGHESMDTTLIYAQSSQENLKMSHKKYVT